MQLTTGNLDVVGMHKSELLDMAGHTKPHTACLHLCIAFALAFGLQAFGLLSLFSTCFGGGVLLFCTWLCVACMAFVGCLCAGSWAPHLLLVDAGHDLGRLSWFSGCVWGDL